MECQQVITEYLRWIKDNTIVKSVEEGKICSISTPFLDRHNDHLDIYLIKNEKNLKLTDNGYTISDLRMSGFEINTPKRDSILKTALNGFGVKVGNSDELFVDATYNNIGQKKHYLLQAILAVNDMFNLAQETVYSLFKEDVELFFRSSGIIFSKDLKLTGKSGFDHNIDFLIPQSKNKPERLIKTINNAKKDTVLSSIMAFNDINQLRETKTQNYVVYNDIEKEVSKDIIYALENYGVKNIPWSKKEFCLSEFTLN
ncbi:MAG: DUF1829 domain-containing protein [Flavobacterium sp.]|jgi:hypothetical protein|nr:DUF1829 domain-containing protein [Flavobacterium sp.]MDY0343827.1 DUF1829 domain-containing protein [Lentimicrobium sp.]